MIWTLNLCVSVKANGCRLLEVEVFLWDSGARDSGIPIMPLAE